MHKSDCHCYAPQAPEFMHVTTDTEQATQFPELFKHKPNPSLL